MVAPGEKLPLPNVDQIPVLLPPLTEPLRVTVLVVAQTKRSVPAFTIGNGTNVIVITSAVGKQLFGVSVKVTIPALMSAALGV